MSLTASGTPRLYGALAGLLTIFVFACLATCSGPSNEPEAPKRVILITVDTLRADHMSVYGYPRQTSPAVSYTHLTLPTNIIRCRSRWSPYH